MRLGDLVAVQKGRKPHAVFNQPRDGFRRLIQIDDLRPGAQPKFCPPSTDEVAVEPSDIAIAWDGANAATSGSGLSGVLGSTLARLRPLQERVVTSYLGHYLKARAGYLRRRCKGATVPHIDGQVLAVLEVPLPSVAEQRRIAAILDQADALRAKRRATLARLDTFTQSIFLDLFGDPATNPKGWPEHTIKDLCQVRGGKRLPKGEEYSATPTPYRYVRVMDLKAGVVDESALVYLKPEVQARIARYVVHAGDVIVSIAGSIGLIAPVPGSLDGANLTENAAKLVPRGGREYDADFLARLLQTPFVQEQIGSHIGQVTIGKLALFRIEKLRVPLPPLGLQRDFARRVDSIERLKSSYRTSLAKLDELFTSLQHRAFRGEL